MKTSSHDDMIRQAVKGKGRQVGGNHYIDFEIMPIEYISKNKIELNDEIGSKIPSDLVELTTNRYVQLYEILTGLQF